MAQSSVHDHANSTPAAGWSRPASHLKEGDDEAGALAQRLLLDALQAVEHHCSVSSIHCITHRDPDPDAPLSRTLRTIMAMRTEPRSSLDHVIQPAVHHIEQHPLPPHTRCQLHSIRARVSNPGSYESGQDSLTAWSLRLYAPVKRKLLPTKAPAATVAPILATLFSRASIACPACPL